VHRARFTSSPVTLNPERAPLTWAPFSFSPEELPARIPHRMRIVERIRDRLSQPIFYEDLRDRTLNKIERGELQLDAPLISIADSLDLVELQMEVEEMGFEISVPITTVGDFLWLVKKIEYRKFRTGCSR